MKDILNRYEELNKLNKDQLINKIISLQNCLENNFKGLDATTIQFCNLNQKLDACLHTSYTVSTIDDKLKETIDSFKKIQNYNDKVRYFKSLKLPYPFDQPMITEFNMFDVDKAEHCDRLINVMKKGIEEYNIFIDGYNHCLIENEGKKINNIEYMDKIRGDIL